MDNIRSILVATDLGAPSDVVMRGAAALAQLVGAELHVLHTYEFQSAPYASDDAPHTFPERIEQIRTTLDEQIVRTLHRQSVASREIMIYVAYKAILERARVVSADLIVIGRHRQGAKGPAFLGSTADRVVRDAKVPCLIIHDPLDVPLRRVLVPIDLSEPAIHALDVALNWSAALSPAGSTPEVIVMHVIPRVYDASDVPFDSSSIDSRIHDEVEAGQMRAEAPASVEVREEVRWADDPAQEILAFIEQEQIDLVVLGTHGHGPIKRALIGSVASGVARAAECPVLLVPPAMWKEES
ncbi:MAG TPA: universal stress protein [Longimicrobiales bacterium]|nr:universal stress protein [Longimicrobiales bacterium]